jgi:hypothetical protein
LLGRRIGEFKGIGVCFLYCKFGRDAGGFYDFIVSRFTVFQHELLLKQLDLSESAAESVHSKISKVHSALMFCSGELGVWLAFQVFS